ncbi:Protein arginine methyltransferase NDUFAF7, mitochondrial [Geodia barretti]|uniref:Protein arginine methyltransferase NDUFAF7 n=1 Tax=Geodia barretti TaxID=519541 RepID=A0AA35XH81_GEOBA|nr:Protein arginine methyltransferase NDUFAF7, mitochondrial [Geodia barretti]
MWLLQRCGVRFLKALAPCRRRPYSVHPPGSVMETLYNRIKLTGPIQVASYMKECLLHPTTGYYMQKDVFGARGDFTTSPEISQVFGELVGVWVLADWMVGGEPREWSLVELGPGRGTLTKDILRVFGQFRRVLDSLSVHLVEASPTMSHLQEKTLTGEEREVVETGQRALFEESPYKTCTLESGVPVHWYQRLEDVPLSHSYIIAHEFFDALPVHQFQGTEEGWREVLVDIDPEKSDMSLRFVVAPGPTPASAAFSSLLPSRPSASGEEGEGGRVRQAEVCPEGLLVAKEIGRRVVEHGGAALVVDYGSETATNHTLRGFRSHQLHDVLTDPSSADLTADVDFGALSRASQGEGAGYAGPITQNEFLHKMGIRQRMQVLLDKANLSEAEQLLSGYEMLTSPEKMGERFKFLTITSSPSHIPTPFVAGVEPFPPRPRTNI